MNNTESRHRGYEIRVERTHGHHWVGYVLATRTRGAERSTEFLEQHGPDEIFAVLAACCSGVARREAG